MWKHEWLSVTVMVVVLVSVGFIEVKSTPLSHQQQLRRRGIARGRSGPVAVSAEPEVIETTEPIVAEYSGNRNLAEQEKQLKAYEKALKTRESELETIKEAFVEREKVLEEREFALDIRDADLDQRSNNIDKQVLETDKRLKEREDRIAAREKALGEREMEILKLAEEREQQMEKLSRERENAAQLREKALEDRELAVAEREKKVEEREIRVQKRMENNRKRFQRRMELRQLDQRVGVVSSSTPRGRSLDFSSIDPVTQATTNHPRRVIEKVTFRKVTSSSPTVSESTVFIADNERSGVTAALSPDEESQVTEAVAYESSRAREYSTTADTGLVTLPATDVNTIGVTTSGKKRKSRKLRNRERKHHHKNHQDEETAATTTTTSTSSRRSRTSRKTEENGSHTNSQKKQRKVRKVVKRMGSDGEMVIVHKN